MPGGIDPYLTEADIVVLKNLLDDVDTVPNDVSRKSTPSALSPEAIEARADQAIDRSPHDQSTIERLQAYNNPSDSAFQPTVFVTWDEKDIPKSILTYVVKPYTNIASKIVRHPTDVVFFTHILLYLCVNLPSAIWLYCNFTYIHGIAHAAFTFWCAGSFTLLMHNHIHNGGVLAKEWRWLDFAFPYITEPLMGHTWDSYYYHHVKHHHVESNGPDDLSSTIRYQRDDLLHFLHYVGRFLFFIWLELPMYFLDKGKTNLAVRAFLSELVSFAFMYSMTFKVNTRASIFVLIIPFVLLRIGLMIGNWGQHALVDEVEPDSDFRSSITLIDVPVSRYHHLHVRSQD